MAGENEENRGLPALREMQGKMSLRPGYAIAA